MKKLALAAFAWDMDDPLNTQRIGGFDARLSSYEFKQQIDKSFGIRLTGPEVGFSKV